MSTQRETTKCSLACEYCRIKKAKCSGTQPCGNCIDHNEECVFPEKRPRTRKRKEREQEMENRLSQMEALLRAATQSTLSDTQSVGISDVGPAASSREQWTQSISRPPSSAAADVIEYMASPTSPLQEDHLQGILASPCPEIPILFPNPPSLDPTTESRRRASESIVSSLAEIHPDSSLSCPNSLQMPVSPPSSATTDNCARNVVLEHNPSPQNNHRSKRRATDKAMEAMVNDDLTCASYLSICTFPAVEWVSRQSGMSDFLISARRLSKAINREERLDKVIDPVRAPEPDLETALKWTKAYFENCLDSIFELIDRRDFETRLRHLFAGGADNTLSKGWYAMRNTVYASGCRFLISEARNPEAFSQSRAQSWKYLENALSVHTELLYGPTDLDCIQALVLMAFHAEALGTPALEYTLLSNATRLAQSKGLHLRTLPGTQVASGDDTIRQRLWWTLYSYEKHLAYRSGIPSAIDDDYISCPVPTSMRRGSSMSGEFFTKTVAQAQISSAASKLLNSAKAMNDPPETILAHVQDLDRRLSEWEKSLHPVHQTHAPFKPSDLPPETQIYHVLFLHFCYHVLVVAIHGVFCYPWSRPDLHANRSPAILEQIQKSTKAVAESSRQIILAVQRLEITAALPVWLTFYFPLVGLINLFVCIIKDPLSPTAASDLSLLDLVVGHFGYLEWMSMSELNLAFPREVASYARDLVNKAKQETMANTPTASSSAVPDGQNPLTHGLESTELASFDALMGLEDWCTFLPPMMQNMFTMDAAFSGTGTDVPQ